MGGRSLLEALLQPGSAQPSSTLPACAMLLRRISTAGGPAAAAAAEAAEEEFDDLSDLLPPAIPIEQQDEQVGGKAAHGSCRFTATPLNR